MVGSTFILLLVAGHQAVLAAPLRPSATEMLLSLFQARTRSGFCPEEGGEGHSSKPFQGEVSAPKGEGVGLHCCPDACLTFMSADDTVDGPPSSVHL